MNDFVSFVIAGLIIINLPILAIAYFQGGFFMKWIKTRAGRGKYVLVKMRSKLRDYFEVGYVEGDFLIFGPKKNQKRVIMPDNATYRAFGVLCVDLDECKNSISKTDFTPVTGHDAEKFEDLYTRALYRPTLEENRDKIMLVLAVITIAAIVVVGFLCWNISQQISALGPATVHTVL